MEIDNDKIKMEIDNDKIETKIDNDKIETKIDNDKITKKSKQRSFWLKLLIDDKNELNTFKIKKNKKIYLITNIYILSLYLMPLLGLIAEIVINFIHLDSNTKFIIYIILLLLLMLPTDFLCFFISGNGAGVYYIGIANVPYLVHSKYLIDKFAHFYNTDFNYIINDYVGELSAYRLSTAKYLKTKDKSELTVNENPKNTGYIFRVYSKNKSKAIKLMELNIKYFFYLSEWAYFYVLILIIIFALLWIL